jgi:hypothetical protein
MVDYIIAAFRSRTHTLQFVEMLRRNRIECTTINTPKEAGVGCGLSVRFTENYYFSVKNILRRYNFDSFAGFFSINHKYGRTMVKVVN